MSKKEIDIILDEIKELREEIRDIKERHIIPMRESIASLNTKAKTWGTISGTIAGGVIAAVTNFIMKR
jgi:hypothetical protein